MSSSCKTCAPQIDLKKKSNSTIQKNSELIKSHPSLQKCGETNSSYSVEGINRAIAGTAMRGLGIGRKRSIFTKLNISKPGDIYEREADRVADTVMSMPQAEEKESVQTKSISESITPFMERECCEGKGMKIMIPIQRKKEESTEVSEKIIRMPEKEKVQKACSTCTHEEPLKEIIQEKPLSISPSFCVTSVSKQDNTLNLYKKLNIQSKFIISKPGDKNKQEADEVANKVMRMSDNHEYLLSRDRIQRQLEGEKENIELLTASTIQRFCEECSIAKPSAEELAEDKMDIEETQVNKKEEGSPREDQNSLQNIESALKKNRGNGSIMPNDTLTFMQNRFGQDFSDVRIHTNSKAVELNNALSSKAFTYGRDIYFNNGRYAPNTEDGRRLIAHELTHTVQQTGSVLKSNIQRLEENKIGNWAHSEIQKRLRKADKDLITEAPIPGATRHNIKHNIVGFADLYKADKHIVSGVMAQEPAESKELEESDKFYIYKNMSKGQMKFSKWSAIASDSPINYGPTIDKNGKWNFTYNFPSTFYIGELKPLFKTDFNPLSYTTLIGAGINQLGNYISGFENFVRTVFVNKGKEYPQLPTSISGQPLKYGSEIIPDAINYEKFESENQKEQEKNAILMGKPSKRVWIYSLKNGVYVYFLLPHPFESATFPEKIEKQLKSLDPMLIKLRQKNEKMGNSLSTKPDKAIAKKTLLPVKNRLSKSNQIQTKTDWKKEGEQWEKERKNWIKAAGSFAGKEKPKEFLKEQAKGFEKKESIDQKLGKVGVSISVSKPMEEKIKKTHKIRFWSGIKGRIYGALRFRFGTVFDKIEEQFQKIKKKFKDHHKNSDKLNKKGGIFDGWKKTATKAIIRFSVVILKEMLVSAFKGFVDCMNGVINAIFGKYLKAVDESKEQLLEEIEPVCCEVMAFKKELEAKYNEHDKIIAQFTDAIETIQKWREILSYVEAAVRLGVQIVSCGSPPALGCLWGLVAQIGIGVGLDLLARTDYFENDIAKPAAQRLMDAIVGDTFHNFLIDLLAKTPLKPYLDEAVECKKRSTQLGNAVIGGNLHKLDPNNPEIVKARAEWEAKYRQQIFKDLQSVFEQKDGKKITKADLEKLLEAVQKQQLTREKLIELIQSGLNSATGKIDINKAQVSVETGHKQEVKTKIEKIDYKEAIQNNILYEQWFHINPTDYIKIPGIKVDTKDFVNGIYYLQEALGLPKPDGMLGPETIVKFHERNNLKKGLSYKLAMKQMKQGASTKVKYEIMITGKRLPVKIINAADVKIKGKVILDNIPKGVKYYLYNPPIKELIVNRSTFKYLTLDIYIDNVLSYRIQDIEIKKINLSELLATPKNVPLISIQLKYGVQLDIKDEKLILSYWLWNLLGEIRVEQGKWYWRSDNKEVF